MTDHAPQSGIDHRPAAQFQIVQRHVTFTEPARQLALLQCVSSPALLTCQYVGVVATGRLEQRAETRKLLIPTEQPLIASIHDRLLRVWTVRLRGRRGGGPEEDR